MRYKVIHLKPTSSSLSLLLAADRWAINHILFATFRSMAATTNTRTHTLHHVKHNIKHIRFSRAGRCIDELFCTCVSRVLHTLIRNLMVFFVVLSVAHTPTNRSRTFGRRRRRSFVHKRFISCTRMSKMLPPVLCSVIRHNIAENAHFQRVSVAASRALADTTATGALTRSSRSDMSLFFVLAFGV